MRKLFLITFILLMSHTQAFDYGKVLIKLPESTLKNSLSARYLVEQSNDLIDSKGLDIKYLRSFNSVFSYGASVSSFSSKESDTGISLGEKLLSNGVVQNLDLKTKSIFLESKLRIGQGVFKFFNKLQALVFVDAGLGVGLSQYKNNITKEKDNKNGLTLSFEMGTLIANSYTISAQFMKNYDGLGDDNSIDNTYLGISLGFLW